MNPESVRQYRVKFESFKWRWGNDERQKTSLDNETKGVNGGINVMTRGRSNYSPETTEIESSLVKLKYQKYFKNLIV